LSQCARLLVDLESRECVVVIHRVEEVLVESQHSDGSGRERRTGDLGESASGRIQAEAGNAAGFAKENVLVRDVTDDPAEECLVSHGNAVSFADRTGGAVKAENAKKEIGVDVFPYGEQEFSFGVREK